MNCWPKCSESQSHKTRAMMSLEPPAAKLTTNFTGRFGYFSCADAGANEAQSRIKATQNRMMRIASLPFRFACAGLGELASLYRSIGPFRFRISESIPRGRRLPRFLPWVILGEHRRPRNRRFGVARLNQAQMS